MSCSAQRRRRPARGSARMSASSSRVNTTLPAPMKAMVVIRSSQLSDSVRSPRTAFGLLSQRVHWTWRCQGCEGSSRVRPDPGPRAARAADQAARRRASVAPSTGSRSRRRPLAALQPPARNGWLGSPRALLRASALQHNIATMAQYCTDRGVDLYPHAKTTMAPQLVAAQLEAGRGASRWPPSRRRGCSTGSGVQHILIANEVVDEGVDRRGWAASWRTTRSSTPPATWTAPRGCDLLDRTLSDGSGPTPAAATCWSSWGTP